MCRLAALALLLLSPALALAECARCAGSHSIACLACGGGKSHTITCPACKGEGTFVCKACDGKGGTPCKNCQAPKPGLTDTTKCKACGGTHWIPCPSCSQGRVTCGSCGGHKELVIVCPACLGDGHVPCPNCSPCASAKTCPFCNGLKRLDCLACSGSGTFETPCDACSSTGGKTCEACDGTGRLSCKKCRGDGKLQGHLGAYRCPECGGAGTTADPKCGGRGKFPCVVCKGKGKMSHKCWGCDGAKKAPCPRCLSAKAWTATEPVSGATVWLFPFADFEPQAQRRIQAMQGAPYVGWRLFVDATKAKDSFTLGNERRWHLVAAPAGGKAILLGDPVPSTPEETRASLEAILEAFWIPAGARAIPVTAQPGQVASRVVWTVTPPSGSYGLRIAAPEDSGANPIDLKLAPATADDWLRLLAQSTSK